MKQKLFSVFSIVAMLVFLITGAYSSQALADCSSQSDIPSAQCQSLVEIYNATNGTNWADSSNWLDDSPCNWYGVTCENGSVSTLNFAGNELSGGVPSLTAFSALTNLNLNFNSLTGSLPDINGLTQLSGADFNSNQFSGSIPEFTNLPNLSYLNLSANSLSGVIPANLATLPSLSRFFINRNSVTGPLSDAHTSLSFEAFHFDDSSLCVVNRQVADWLDAIANLSGQYSYCWEMQAELGAEQLATGDTLKLLVRIQDHLLDASLAMDLYLSLLLPDEQTEAFLVFQGADIGAVFGSPDPASWAPIAQGVSFGPGSDTGLLPVFAYQLTGTEPLGYYRWKIRATRPGTTEIIHEAESGFYYSHMTNVEIIAAQQASSESDVSFQIQLENELPNTVYHWDFDDGSTATGKQLVHNFSTPDRYRVAVSIEVDSVVMPTTYYHFINIGRAYEQTIYPQAGTAFSPSTTEVLDFSWNDCDPNWNVYYGKYNNLWIEASAESNIAKEQIINYLLYSDFIFESYSEIFGWSVLPSGPAHNSHACGDIGGAGTGSGGTFMNTYTLAYTGRDSIRVEDFKWSVHEYVHLWDFRGSAWISSWDAAHTLTDAMQPIVDSVLGTGGVMTSWGGDQAALSALPPTFVFNHYFRVALNRYLSHPELNWESISSTEFAATAYEDINIPEHKETMLVPAGLLMSLFNMHGAEGLRSIFLEIDDVLLKNPQWLDGFGYSITDQELRANNFMKAVADSLQLDVSDYFEYWKYPIAGLDDYMAQYPLSDKINDGDGDGFSPLHGDLDDADSSVFPYAPELLDGKDNNQDGLVDENVYTEAAGDVDVQEVTLPASIIASISDLEDEDTFQFTLEEAAVVTFTFYSADSDSVVDYSPTSNRDISIFAGSVYVDGGYYTALVHDQMQAPETVSARTFGAGTHTVRLTSSNPDGRNSNPGDYEAQIFINDYETGITSDGLLNQLYP